jgi:transcriptional regulator with XRE-family HTH domain
MFPERLTKLREERNLSKTFMGKLVGVTRQAYSKYEEGKSEPDMKTIGKLASFFGVNVEYLIGETDDPTPVNSKDTVSTAFHDYDNLTDEEKEYLERQLEIFRDIKKK